MDLKLTTSARPEKLDSVIYFQADEDVDALFTFRKRNKFADFFYTVLKNEENPSEV